MSMYTSAEELHIIYIYVRIRQKSSIFEKRASYCIPAAFLLNVYMDTRIHTHVYVLEQIYMNAYRCVYTYVYIRIDIYVHIYKMGVCAILQMMFCT